MATIKKILKDSFEDVKEDIKLVHEINKENLEIVKAVNRANLEEARRLEREFRDVLSNEDNGADEDGADSGSAAAAD